MTYTIGYPATMMVHSKHTSTAFTAVVSPRRLKTVAFVADVKVFRPQEIYLLL